MSEPAPEVPRPRGPKPPAQAKGGLGKKVGPLPVWAWGAIIIGTIGFILFVRSKSKGSGSVTAPVDSSGITDFGGGPPAPPANGVVPPGYNWTDPCPPGFTLVAGACVPTDVADTPPKPGGGGTVPVSGPGGPPIVPGRHPIYSVTPLGSRVGFGGATHALHENLATRSASTQHAPVKRIKRSPVGG